MRDLGFPLLLVVVGVALAVGGIAASCAAPCSWFAGAPLKDVPARCVGEIVGGGR